MGIPTMISISCKFCSTTSQVQVDEVKITFRDGGPVGFLFFCPLCGQENVSDTHQMNLNLLQEVGCHWVAEHE